MRKSLSVGINEYPTSPLRGCVNDALDWRTSLQERGYQTGLMLDKAATKSTMLAALEILVDGARWGDRLVFTYSGHGTFVPDRDGDELDRRDEALVSVDMRTITDDELHGVLGRIPRGVRLTIVSDSCHSGTMTRSADSHVVYDVAGEPAAAVAERLVESWDLTRSRFLDPSQVTVERADKPKGLPARSMLLSGCADHEVSYDAYIGGRYRGAMTAAALEALPAARNMRDWHRRTLAAIKYPQTPQLSATSYQRYGFRPFV